MALELTTFLPYRLSLLSRLAQDLLASQLQASAVTVAQWRVYLCLANLGPSALNSIAEFTRLPQSSLSRSIAQMAERGLVHNERDPEDRRIARIALTAAGRRDMEALTRKMHTAFDGLFGLDAQEEAAFLHTIDDLIARLGERLGVAAADKQTREPPAGTPLPRARKSR